MVALRFFRGLQGVQVAIWHVVFDRRPNQLSESFRRDRVKLDALAAFPMGGMGAGLSRPAGQIPAANLRGRDGESMEHARIFWTPLGKPIFDVVMGQGARGIPIT